MRGVVQRPSDSPVAPLVLVDCMQCIVAIVDVCGACTQDHRGRLPNVVAPEYAFIRCTRPEYDSPMHDGSRRVPPDSPGTWLHEHADPQIDPAPRT